MFDIHCHVIPNVDDGAINIDDSLDMCRNAFKSRVKAIVATPHFRDGISEVSVSTILSKVANLNANLKDLNINITVLPGMEVYVTPNLVKLYNQGTIITLNFTKYMLIEFPTYVSEIYLFERILFNLQLKGIKPIIAHPERCRAIIKNPELICRLINKDCVMQVNSGSIEGMFGNDVKKTALTLLKHNMVHVIASDNHSVSKRMQLLNNSYKTISKKFGKVLANNLFISNPHKIINGQDIHIEEPIKMTNSIFGIFSR